MSLSSRSGSSAWGLLVATVSGLPADRRQAFDDQNHADEERRQVKQVDGIAFVPPGLLPDAGSVRAVIALEVRNHDALANHGVILQVDIGSRLKRLDLRGD